MPRTSSGTATATRRRRFRPRDLRSQVMIQDVTVAPDGSAIVYSRRTIDGNEYRTRLWRTTFRGRRPVPLTGPGGVDVRPRFSPDGSSLLFLSARSGSTQPWILPLSGGEPRRLATVAGDVAVAEWSPDGRTVLLLAPSGHERFTVGDTESPLARRITEYNWRRDGEGIRNQFTSIWTVPARGGRPRRLTSPGVDVVHAFWSPDGRRIGFLADMRPDAALWEWPEVWSVSREGGRPRHEAGLEGEIVTAGWGPSGALVFTGNAKTGSPGWANAELFVAVGDDVRQLGAGLDRPIANVSYGDLLDPTTFFPPPVWLDDDTLLMTVADHGSAIPHRFTLGGDVEPLAGGEIVCTALAAGGGRIAAVVSDGGPGEVFALEDGGLRQLTTDGSRWFGAFRRSPERVSVPHQDGHRVEGWLLPARGAKRRGPAVLVVHGGPHLAFPPVPWMEMLALSDAGFHVLWTNPRGSAGYGEEYGRVLDGAWGDPDGADLLRVVDWAVRRGLVDRRRVGVMGLSYGGFMTTWLLGHHPGVFAAAVSENPVTDLIGEYGSSDYGRQIAPMAVGVDELTADPARFVERSPATAIHRNEAPLLLLQAESDLRCPPGQSEIVFAIMTSLGRPVEMVRYPDESHTMFLGGRPDRRVDRLERIVDWFAVHLRQGAHAGASRPASRPRPRRGKLPRKARGRS